MNQKTFKAQLSAKFFALASSYSPDFSEIASLMADPEIEAYIASDEFTAYLAELARPDFFNPTLIKRFIESEIILRIILNVKKRTSAYLAHWGATAEQSAAILGSYREQLRLTSALEESIRGSKELAQRSKETLDTSMRALNTRIYNSQIHVPGEWVNESSGTGELASELGYSTATAYSSTSHQTYIPAYDMDTAATVELRRELAPLETRHREALEQLRRYEPDHAEILRRREVIQGLIRVWTSFSDLTDKGAANRGILALIPKLEAASVALSLLASRYSTAAAPGETASIPTVLSNQTSLRQRLLTLTTSEVLVDEIEGEKRALLKSWLIKLVQNQINRRVSEPDSFSFFGFRFSFGQAQKVEALQDLLRVIQSAEARRTEAVRALTDPALRQGKSARLYALALSVFSQIEVSVPTASAAPVAMGFTK